MQQFRDAMSRALFLANRASSAGDVPVGAVVVDPLGNIVGEGWNVREAHHDPTGHAEIIALRQAGERLKRWNLVGCTLVVTLEPCTMCAGAAVAARVDRVVFGAWEPKTGAAGSLRDVLRDSRMGQSIEVIPGVLAQEASAQIIAFFEECRRRETLKDRVPPALSLNSGDTDVASRSLTAALRAQAARTSRSWEGAGAGHADSRVLADDQLLAVEWDDEARAKYGKLPKVPTLSSGPRYGTLSAAELRALDAARKGIPLDEATNAPSPGGDPSQEDVSLVLPEAEVVETVVAPVIIEDADLWVASAVPPSHMVNESNAQSDQQRPTLTAGSAFPLTPRAEPPLTPSVTPPAPAPALSQTDTPANTEPEKSASVTRLPEVVTSTVSGLEATSPQPAPSVPALAEPEAVRPAHTEPALAQAERSPSEPQGPESDKPTHTRVDDARLQGLPADVRSVIAGIAQRRQSR